MDKDKYKGGFIQKKLEWDIQSPTDKRQLVSCISQAAAFWHVLMVWAPVMEWGGTRWHATPGGGGSNSLIDITAVIQHETEEISKSLTPPGLIMSIP